MNPSFPEQRGQVGLEHPAGRAVWQFFPLTITDRSGPICRGRQQTLQFPKHFEEERMVEKGMQALLF